LKKPIQFGKYYLLDRVNVGGMAEVFKAKAFGVEGFERLLAVKRILPNIAEDEEFITMFIDEAKISVQLNHANIAQIFDLGKVEDSYFIALEFVHGKDLRAIFDRCKGKPLDVNGGAPAMPIPQACFITMKCCEGLDYAHNKRDGSGGDLNLVHRDVSPQNVLISYEGEIKIIDFGIAKAAGKASKTQQGILKGKFGYMSPEQVRGLPLDRRSDIFALGIVLYEVLTGERLFVGESDFSTLEKVRNVEILPPSTYNRRISDELERIVMKALAKDVEDRYQNAIDLHDDLQAYMYSAGEFYSRKDLAAWMKKVWAAEIEAETAKLESYQKMTPPDLSRPSEQPRGKRTLPPASGPAPSAGPRMSGQHAVVSSAPPPPPPSLSMSQNTSTDLGWDDEELATNIYETAADAEDAVVDDEPDDFSNLDLSSDGEPVPHASVTAAKEPLKPQKPSPAQQLHKSNGDANGRNGNGSGKAGPQQRTVEMRAPTLSGMGAQGAQPVGQKEAKNAKTVEMQAPDVELPPMQSPSLSPRPGPKTLERELFDLPLPPPPGSESLEFEGVSLPALATAVSQRPSAPVRARPPQRRGSRTPLYIGLGVVALLLIGGGVGTVLYMNGRPGELVVTSDPAADVKLSIDGKPAKVDGTPATLSLDPGPHKVTVSRDGYLPSTAMVEVKAGERLQKRFVLEAFSANTGFTLMSEPSGLQALLDGQPLEGVTPLKVQAVPPGSHKIEVRNKNGQSSSQEVTLETGKMIEVRVVVGVASAPRIEPKVVAPEPKPEPKIAIAPEPKPEKVKPEPKPEKVKPVAAAEPKPEKVKPEPKEPKVAAPDKGKKPRELPRLASEDLPSKPDKKAAPPEEKKSAGGEGYLRLGSKPWTNIAVDGKDTGLHTPQTQMKLGAGSHRVTLANPQFNIKETFSVDIKAGETVTLIKDLRPKTEDGDW